MTWLGCNWSFGFGAAYLDQLYIFRSTLHIQQTTSFLTTRPSHKYRYDSHCYFQEAAERLTKDCDST